MCPINTDIEKLKRLVSAMANKLASNGYQVKADHIGYPNGKPDEYNRYTPDIFAEKNDEKIIIEASDCQTLESEDTRLRWIALSAVKDVKFSIIVPKSCIAKARELTKKWGITVSEFWNMNI